MIFGQSQECWDAFALVFITAGSSCAAAAVNADLMYRIEYMLLSRNGEIAESVMAYFYTVQRNDSTSDVTMRQSQLIRLQSARVSRRRQQQQTAAKQVNLRSGAPRVRGCRETRRVRLEGYSPT